MLKLEIAASAKTDLRAIASFTESEFGRRQRDAYIDSISARFQFLLERPMVGVDRSELGADLRAIRASAHVIYYIAQGERLLIVRVLHHAQDAAAAFAIEP